MRLKDVLNRGARHIVIGVGGSATGSITFWMSPVSMNNLKGQQWSLRGEGAIDRQTLDGKGPFGVACRAKALNIPVIAVAGRIALDGDEELAAYFDALIPINHDVLPLEALKECNVENLKRTGKLIGNLLQIGAKKTGK